LDVRLAAAAAAFACCDGVLVISMPLSADFSSLLRASSEALMAAAVAGAIGVDPVADWAFGILSSQRRTAVTAVHPLFFRGSFSSWASTLVKVWSRSSGMAVFGFFLIISSKMMCSFFPHQSAAKVPA
jgi:hypothetical protein